MLTIPLVHLIVRLVRRVTPPPRHVVLNLLSFYFIPIVGSIVSLLYTGMPGTWTCAAVSLVLLYINDQDREIVRDGLTGLNNRKTLDGVFSEYEKAGEPLYLFMMDLDRFKQINDTYGHPVGDQALVAAANLLSASMIERKGILVRYGGDEFLIMGFFENDADAEGFKRAILQRFDDYRREHNPHYWFSMSIGYSRYVPGQTLEDLIEQADHALYQEKQRTNAGR
jgi:diguanylate cyclase (GGDEF)-like protein